MAGYNACDDGNLVNGDGCSSDCRIEKNFRCEGGSDTTKDICYSKIKPVATLHKIYNDKFQIQFSKPVRIFDGKGELDIDKIVTIRIEGYKKPDNFTYNITSNKIDTTDPKNKDLIGSIGQAAYDPSHKYYTYFNVSFQFLKSIPPNTKIEYEFNRTLIIDVNTNSLTN